MVIAGGLPLEWDWKGSDPWVTALGIIDVSGLKWVDRFDASAAAYESPQMVQDWYSQG